MIEKMERMDRKKRYYLISNEKQTLIACELEKNEIKNVLKFDGKDWVEDNEVFEVVKRCYQIYVMDDIAKHLTSDFEFDRIINQKREARKIADEQAEAELLEKIEKRDAERKATNPDNDDKDTKK